MVFDRFHFLILKCLPSSFVQASSSFDGMGSKSRIVDVNDAFGAADTMSIGDVLGKNTRKKAHKASDPLSEATPKKARPSSAVAATPAKLVFASALPTNTLGSRW